MSNLVLAVERDVLDGLNEIVAIELLTLGELAVALVAHVVGWRRVDAVHREARIDAYLARLVAPLDAHLRLAVGRATRYASSSNSSSH